MYNDMAYGRGYIEKVKHLVKSKDIAFPVFPEDVAYISQFLWVGSYFFVRPDS